MIAIHIHTFACVICLVSEDEGWLVSEFVHVSMSTFHVTLNDNYHEYPSVPILVRAQGAYNVYKVYGIKVFKKNHCTVGGWGGMIIRHKDC